MYLGHNIFLILSFEVRGTGDLLPGPLIPRHHIMFTCLPLLAVCRPRRWPAAPPRTESAHPVTGSPTTAPTLICQNISRSHPYSRRYPDWGKTMFSSLLSKIDELSDNLSTCINFAASTAEEAQRPL